MRIVVGALRSPEGEAAVREAAREAALRGGRILLVGYVPTPLDQQASRRYDQDRRAVQATLDALATALLDDGADVSIHIPIGVNSPADAILEVAREEGAELIVIGVRRRSRVGKLVLGSNAQDILLGATAAVLAVKPRDEAEDAPDGGRRAG